MGTDSNTPSPTPGTGTPNFSGDSCYFPDPERRQRHVEPPVTKATLSELDVNKIIHNPKLRHDINFDPELHFRPNLDGDKGRRKQEKANQFWKALIEQIGQFVTERETVAAWGDDWCLPLLLKSVKDIIQTLVPARDRSYLDEGLNVELMMQQFNRGMADLDKLAAWLSGVLKSHCAPMRDEWVDDMYQQLTTGNRTNNVEELVQGMRSLLGVLEAMKLDVANHQIRCLRPALIEDTVYFERRFFHKKIRDGKLDPSSAKSWYAGVASNYAKSQQMSGRSSDFNTAFGETAPFFEALTHMIMPSHHDPCPSTFLFDEERILKLRSDMFDAIHLDVCMRLYEQLERTYKHSQGSSSLQQQHSDLPSYLTTADLDDDFEVASSNPSSRPSSLVLSHSGSTPNSSPRSSLVMLQSSFAAAEEQRQKAQNLYNSLVALLQSGNAAPAATGSASATHPPAQRWHAVKDSLALEIFRSTNAPAHALSHFERTLDRHLSCFDGMGPDEDSEVYALVREAELHFQRRLINELQHRVREFRGLTAVGLFSVATGGRLQGPGRTWDGQQKGADKQSQQQQQQARGAAERDLHSREDGSVEDMATRLAHLGILHWRVWGELVYLAPTEPDDTEMST